MSKICISLSEKDLDILNKGGTVCAPLDTVLDHSVLSEDRYYYIFVNKNNENELIYETINKQTNFEEEFVYESKTIANRVFQEMIGIALVYGFVRVSEFKDMYESLSNVKPSRKYIDSLYGWTYAGLCSKARIVSLKSGYTIRLPEPMRIV